MLKTDSKGTYAILIFMHCITFAVLWFVAEARYELMVNQRAMHDLHLLQLGQTPHVWTLQHQQQDLQDSHALGNKRSEDGRLKFTSQTHEAAFNLNLKSRFIDARYHRLVIQLVSDAPTTLQIFHSTTDNEQYTLSSPQFRVEKGSQTLVIDLRDINWDPVYIGKDDQPGLTPLPIWGSRSGVISRLRIDPTNAAGVSFSIDEIRLESSDRVTVKSPIVTTFDALEFFDYAEQGFDRLLGAPSRAPNEFRLYLNRSAVSTPELNRWMRSDLLRNDPSSIVARRHLPNRNNSVAPKDTSWDSVSSIEQLIAFTLLAAGLLLILIFAAPANRIRNALHYTALVSVLISCWIGILWSLWPLVLTYLFMASYIFYIFHIGYRHSTAHSKSALLQYLGFKNPEPNGWIIALAVTLLVGLVVIFLAIYTDSIRAFSVSSLIASFSEYLAWGTLQQLLLGPFVAGFLRTLLAGVEAPRVNRDHWVILLTATIFALLHYPNFSLMMPTYLLAILWVYLYLKYGSILPQICSHALLGTLFREFAPAIIQMEGDIGPVYFAWLTGGV